MVVLLQEKRGGWEGVRSSERSECDGRVLSGCNMPTGGWSLGAGQARRSFVQGDARAQGERDPGSDGALPSSPDLEI